MLNLTVFDNLSVTDFTWTDMPVVCESDDYTEAISRYTESILSGSDLLGIYQIGGISVPGVSDLDLIVVLKDNLENSRACDYSPATLTDKYRYLFMHSPYFLNASTFTDIHKLFPIFEMKHIYGQQLPLADVSTQRRESIRLSSAVDYLPYLMMNYLHTIVSRTIHTRPMLCLLHSLNHSLQLTHLPLAQNDDAEEYRALTVYLREAACGKEALSQHWRKSFLRALVLGLELILQMIDAVDEKLRQTDLLGNHRLKGYACLYISRRHCHVFTDPWDKSLWKRGIQCSFTSRRTLKRYIEFLPTTFLAQFQAYTDTDGPVSEFLTRNILLHQRNLRGLQRPETEPPAHPTPVNPYTDALRDKAALINAQASFLVRNGFRTGQLAGFQFFRNDPPATGWLKRFLAFTNRTILDRKIAAILI